jgi:hypothetical protein
MDWHKMEPATITIIALSVTLAVIGAILIAGCVACYCFFKDFDVFPA